jgi:hypothetical protein
MKMPRGSLMNTRDNKKEFLRRLIRCIEERLSKGGNMKNRDGSNNIKKLWLDIKNNPLISNLLSMIFRKLIGKTGNQQQTCLGLTSIII